MQHKAFGHYLNDVAGFGVGQGCFEHCFVVLGVEAVANLWRNPFDAVFAENVQQLAHGQLYTLKQARRCLALFFGRCIQRTFEVVIDRQHVTGEL